MSFTISLCQLLLRYRTVVEHKVIESLDCLRYQMTPSESNEHEKYVSQGYVIDILKGNISDLLVTRQPMPIVLTATRVVAAPYSKHSTLATVTQTKMALIHQSYRPLILCGSGGRVGTPC